MRKTLIALILVLPMVFVLVIFSSVNLVSLGVNIAVNGITIRAEGTDEEGTLLIDMADTAAHTVTAEVSPNNATEKGYTLISGDPTVVDITKDGVIVPKKEGTAEITAKSNDKSFTDTMSVVVVSSKPYDFDFALFVSSAAGSTGPNLLTETEEGYEATLPTGNYTFGMDIYPVEYTQYTLKQESGEAEIERGPRTLFLPFSGDVKLTATVPDGVKGDIQKNITLHVTKPTLTGPDGKVKEAVAIINGAAAFPDDVQTDTAVFGETGGSMQIAHGTTELRLYVECAGRPTFASDRATLKGLTGTNGRYILDLDIDPEADEGFNAVIRAGGKIIPFVISFADFEFAVFSDRTIETDAAGGKSVTLLTGNAVSFYAVASAGAKGVAYSWEFSGPKDYFAEQDGVVTVKATKGGEFVLKVTAAYGNREPVTQEIRLKIINKISVVQIANNIKTDLAGSYTVAGKAFAADFSLIDNSYPLRVYTHSTAGTGEAGEDIEYSVSDENVANITLASGKPVLVPKATGKVTVTAAWKGNAAFKANVVANITVNVVMDAVAVKNAPELVEATGRGLAVVLTENIKLGTDAAGNAFSLEQRNEYLKAHRFKSTYNIEWYKNTKDAKEADAYLSYVLEFTNDVYGNGKSIDADNFTHVLDGTGKPRLELYKGPLYFVNFKQTASVAGQDNCAFLVRTDGVKLYGVNLLGCSDDSLLNENGEYDLTNLNLTGTTLEVNADCEIVNCRIRNGRNVVRAYGGNRKGEAYFLDRLTGNPISNEDHIDVAIEGCILSQGREFILKMGANRALRASTTAGADPQLVAENGAPYAEAAKSNRYANLSYDPASYFYTRYVMTDVTLKDSVLETSGLFTVGIESNFAGQYLYSGGERLVTDWERSGGTSFAAVLRLQGDVRLYDWKRLDLVDSSTLIESPVNSLSEWLKLDIKGMLDFVSTKNPELYGNVIETTSDGNQYVHGGIALYGGGRNYSAVMTEDLDQTLADFMYINVNISVLSDGEGALGQQGALLPKAAGSHDFNFYMYGKNSRNNFAKQRADELRGNKYSGVTALTLLG